MSRPFTPEQEAPEQEAMVAERIANFPRTTGRLISPEYTIASPPERSKLKCDLDHLVALKRRLTLCRTGTIEEILKSFRERNLEEEGSGHGLAEDRQNTGTSETSHKRKRKGKGKKDKLKNLGNSGF